MLELELTQSATEDLRDISGYTLDNWGAEQEDRYLKGFYSKFSEIISDPSRWRFRNDLFKQCQIAYFGRHVILFLCHQDRLTVVRVLHSAMDFSKHIPEKF